MIRRILPGLILAWLLSSATGWAEQQFTSTLHVFPRWDNVPLYADQFTGRSPDLESSYLANPSRQVLLQNVLNEFAWPATVEAANGQWLRIRDDGRCSESGRPRAGWVSADAVIDIAFAIEHYTRQIELSRTEWAYWLRGAVYQEQAEWQLAINDYTAAIALRRSCLSPAVVDDLRYYQGLDEAFSRRGHCQIQALEQKSYSEADCKLQNATLARLPALYNHWIAASLRCRPVTLERWALGYLIHITPAKPMEGCGLNDAPKPEPEKQPEEKCAGCNDAPRLAPPANAQPSKPSNEPTAAQPEPLPAPACPDTVDAPNARYFDMRIFVVPVRGLENTGITAQSLDEARRCELPLPIYSPVELQQAAAHFERLASVDPRQLCRRAQSLMPDFAECHLTLALLHQWPSCVGQPLETVKFEAALHETDLAISAKEDYADALRWRAMLLLRQSYCKSRQGAKPLIDLAKKSAMASCEAVGFTGPLDLQVLAAVLARAEDYSLAVRRQRLATSLADDDVANDWLAYYCSLNAKASSKKLSCCPQRNP